MQRTFGRLVVVSWLIAAAGCVTVVPAPGAEQVRLTQKPADVAGCTSAGNVHLPPDEQNTSAEVTFRNLVVGLGGNTALVTNLSLGGEVPIDGIAYRCPSGKPVTQN